MRITSSQALHKPCLTPLPTQVRPEAGLLDEDSEKRVLREKLETIEAQSPDQLAKDLKKFSGLFNQNLQAIATDNRIKGASGKLPLMNPSDPFVGKVRYPGISSHFQFPSSHVPSCCASGCDGQQVHFHRGFLNPVAN